MEAVSTAGGIQTTESRPATELANGFTYFRRNDVLLAKITPCFENGKGACLDQLPTSIGFGSTEFIVLRAQSNLVSRYLYLLTTIPYFRVRGADAMTGSAGQQRVPTDFVKNYIIPVPPLEEQEFIVRFVQAFDHRFSRLIRNKRRLIALLNEEKQAIIQQAVTRGLDPDVPLKPSGVEWLGDIPDHWEVKRNGALFDLRKAPSQTELPILEVSLKTGVRVRDLSAGQRKQMMADLSKYQTAKRDDISYNMMRMWQGAVGVVPEDGLISPAYVVLRPRSDVESEYFACLYRTQPYMQEVDNFSRGIVKDRNRLYWDRYKLMPSPVPPLSEQRAIVQWIEETTTSVDSTISMTLREINLIREYRTRLISDVVTGQLDVRDVQFDDDFTVENLDLGEVELLDNEDVSSQEIDEMIDEEGGVA